MVLWANVGYIPQILLIPRFKSMGCISFYKQGGHLLDFSLTIKKLNSNTRMLEMVLPKTSHAQVQAKTNSFPESELGRRILRLSLGGNSSLEVGMETTGTYYVLLAL